MSEDMNTKFKEIEKKFDAQFKKFGKMAEEEVETIKQDRKAISRDAQDMFNQLDKFSDDFTDELAEKAESMKNTLKKLMD